MEVIHLTEAKKHSLSDLPPISLAIGYFDGVHIGHQRVIGTAKEIADQRGLKSGVMTFDPSPKAVLGSSREVQYITPLNDKIHLIERLGVDYLFVVPFTKEFSNFSPERFIDEYIIGLNVRHLVCGFDFTYGKFGKGTTDTLPIHSKGRFTCTVVDKIMLDGEKISSTAIRNFIKQGDVERAANYLGRFYGICGIVVHGEKRGRTIGFPTANINVDSRYVLPKDGVYAVQVRVKDRWIPGVCNIGFKPTFQNDYGKRSIEVHLLDFDGDLYGETVVLTWYKRIRNEQKFTSVKQLSAQIQRDKEETADYFKNISN